MSISILANMNASGYPVDGGENGRLLEMAQFTAEQTPSEPDVIDARALSLIIRRNPKFEPLTPVYVIAGSIGVRAARLDMDISSTEGEGFRLSEGLEYTQFRTGRLKAESAIKRQGRPAAVPTLLGHAVEAAGSGGSQLTPLPALIGYAVAARTFLMSKGETA